MKCNHCKKRNARKNKTQCKICTNQVINWKKKHPERIRQLNMKSLNKNRIKWRISGQKHFLKLKTIVVDYYSAGTMSCICCNEDIFEFLTINHIKGGGLKHRREIGTTGGGMFYRWLIQHEFPRGFNVLCWNCNWANWRFGICPHRGKHLNRGICPHKDKK